MQTAIRRSWEIRLFHWLFFSVIMLKFWSGFYISVPHPVLGLPNLYWARLLHALMTPVLASLLTFRLYFALVSGNWKDLLIWHPQELPGLVAWFRYFFFLDRLPPTPEKTYPSGQRLLFTAIILTMPLFYGTGVLMLNLPSLRWLNVFFGGQGVARLVHFLVSVLLAVLAALHIYLATTSSLDRLKAMIYGKSLLTVPGTKRSNADESDSPGGTGQSGHV